MPKVQRDGKKAKTGVLQNHTDSNSRSASHSLFNVSISSTNSSVFSLSPLSPYEKYKKSRRKDQTAKQDSCNEENKYPNLISKYYKAKKKIRELKERFDFDQRRIAMLQKVITLNENSSGASDFSQESRNTQGSANSNTWSQSSIEISLSQTLRPVIVNFSQDDSRTAEKELEIYDTLTRGGSRCSKCARRLHVTS